jgi:hypothetical protein
MANEGLVEAAGSGSRLEALCVLRDRLARDLDAAVLPRDVAVLALRLTDVLEQIDSLPASRGVSAADEIAQRRERRRSG